MMGTVVLQGTVVAGVGGAKNYLASQHIASQVAEKVGFKPYPGTLNIRLSKESTLKRQEFHHDKEDRIHPQVNVFPGILIKAQIGQFECAIIHPEDHNYPADIVEVIAPINLREKLNLTEGSKVTLTVQAH